MLSSPDDAGALARLLELTAPEAPTPLPPLNAAVCTDLDMMEAGRRARRSYAAFALRMISGYILYQKSQVRSQRQVAQVCRKWIFARGKQHVLTFDSVLDDVLELDPEKMRLMIRSLDRNSFLHDVRVCVEDEEAKERACREDDEADDEPD